MSLNPSLSLSLADSDKETETEALIPCRRDFHFLPHQETGVRWMKARECDAAVVGVGVGAGAVCCGGILADDMGLGKTCQTIGLLKNSAKARSTLIVCPVALLDAWRDELKACGFQVSVLVQSSPVWSVPLKEGEKGVGVVFLTTYPKLVMYYKSIAAMKFQRIVLDEGHVIRNKNSARFAAALLICTTTTARWILSATPIQNGVQDWKHLCEWLNCDPETDSSDILLRRTMAELRHVIAGLPPAPVFVDHDLIIPHISHISHKSDNSDNSEKCEKSNELALLESIVRRFHAEENETIQLVLMMRIQQFFIHPQIYYDSLRLKQDKKLKKLSKSMKALKNDDTLTGIKETDKSVQYSGTATKWEEFTRVLCDSDEPTIVFCNFQFEIRRVAALAAEKGFEVFVIQGGTRNIGSIVDNARASSLSSLSSLSSQSEKPKPVLVIVQIVVGGAGLNLQFCSRILFLSRHWNPAVVHQAVGRAVRFGQEKVVAVHFFRIVNDFPDLDIHNIDTHMSAVHRDKIQGAVQVVDSLYEGFHLQHDSITEEEEEDSETEE